MTAKTELPGWGQPRGDTGVRVTARQSLGNYVSSVAGNYVFLAFSFATSVYLTRGLGADRFGRLTLVFTLVQTASLFAGFWTHAGFLRHGAEELAREGTLRRVFWGRMIVVTPPVLAFLALGWGLRTRIAAFHGAGEVGSGALAAYFLALFVNQTLQVVYQARGRAGAFAFFQAGERALVLASLLALHLHAQPTLPRILFVYIGASALASLAAGALVDARDVLPVGTSDRTVRRFMDFSWPILIGVFGGYFASNWLDIVILRHFLGTVAVGQYGLAYQLMGAVQQVPMVSFPVIVPLLVGAHVSDRNALIQLYLDRVVPHAVFAMTVVLAAGILAGPALITAIFGDAFRASARAFPVLLFAVGWYCVFISYIPILNLHERTRSMLAASMAAAAVNLAGDLALIPVWGILGAAGATVLSQCVGALVVAGVARRDYRVSVGPVLLILSPLGFVVLGGAVARGPVDAALTGGGAAVLLALVARAQRLGSASDRQLLASLDLPGSRWLRRAPAAGDLR